MVQICNCHQQEQGNCMMLKCVHFLIYLHKALGALYHTLSGHEFFVFQTHLVPKIETARVWEPDILIFASQLVGSPEFCAVSGLLLPYWYLQLFVHS